MTKASALARAALLLACLAACSPTKPTVVDSTYSGSGQVAVRTAFDPSGRPVRQEWFTKDGAPFAVLEYWEGFPWNGKGIVSVDGMDDFLVVTLALGERKEYRLLDNADVMQHRRGLKSQSEGGVVPLLSITMKEMDAMPYPQDILQEAFDRSTKKSD